MHQPEVLQSARCARFLPIISQQFPVITGQKKLFIEKILKKKKRNPTNNEKSAASYFYSEKKSKNLIRRGKINKAKFKQYQRKVGNFLHLQCAF